MVECGEGRVRGGGVCVEVEERVVRGGGWCGGGAGGRGCVGGAKRNSVHVGTPGDEWLTIVAMPISRARMPGERQSVHR